MKWWLFWSLNLDHAVSLVHPTLIQYIVTSTTFAQEVLKMVGR